MVVVAVVSACSSNGDGPPDVVLTSIDLSPASATMQVGATQQFSATGHYSDGSTASVAVTWSATGGSVSSAGVYTAGTVAGPYQVVATEQGGSISKAASVTVTAAPPVLTSITVLPSPISLAPADTQQFVATGHYSGGGTGTVAVTWTATGGTIDAAGLFTAGSAAGAWQVTATQTGGSMFGTAAVTITPAPPTLTSITVAPASVTLIPTATAQFTATAHYSDNSTGTIPVTWTATGGTVSSDGVYTAGTVAGAYQVVATEQGGSISKAASVTVTAAPPVLTSITVLPSPISLAPAGTQQFVATGHYSGGGTGTVAVTWTATGGTIDAAGLFTAGSAAGAWQVTATQTGGSMFGTAAVTITPAPPTLTSITVAPASVTLIPTATAQFTATAHYSDNSTGTIPVTWTATGGTVSSDGVYTAGTVAGGYQVVATATGGTISGSASVTIATPPPNIVAIEISPSTLVRLKPKTTAQYTAIGRLSDGGTTPVAIDWTTTSAPPPAIAPYNAIAADGLFTSGHALGSFLVVATQHSGTLADTVTVNVHETTGKTVQGPLFWAPVAGSVYMCTSNHFTDDGDGLGGVATISAVDGVVAPSTRNYTNIGAPFMYADGAGEVQVICSEVWHAPSGLVGTEQVTIDVVSNRPGTGMAKGFVYTNPCLTSDCRAGFTSQLPIPDPTWTTAPVTATVTVSATTGANIWFKNTYVP